MTPNELRTNKSRSLRAHSIVWEETTEPAGFSHLNEQLRGVRGYQFEVSQGEGRVHGLFIDDSFYIVWLDPNHELYKGV